MIFGDVATVVALIAVALLAGLWRPARHGAALLGGAIVVLAAQAISALIQVSQSSTSGLLGISPAQAQADGVTASASVTAIFWVFCLFVIAMALACAWLVTTPSAAPSVGTAVNPFQPNPGTGYQVPGYQADDESPAADESEDEQSLTEDTMPDGDTDHTGDTSSSAGSEVSTL